MGNKLNAPAAVDGDATKAGNGEDGKASLWLRECPLDKETAEEVCGEITGTYKYLSRYDT